MIRASITRISCILSFSTGLALAPAKVIEKPVTVKEYVPIFHLMAKGKYFGAQADRIAAAIPMSALMPIIKHRSNK